MANTVVLCWYCRQHGHVTTLMFWLEMKMLYAFPVVYGPEIHQHVKVMY